MNPSFFGPPNEQLLGIHHPPRGGSRGVGVLLCPPAPMETARTHWAFRKLAEQLTKAGYDVLRFDYRGTGDSNGELADTTPLLWVEDIKRAARELKDVSGVRKISAVGFRLGALLLCQAASEGLALDALVLWEPVVSVANWMEQLRLIERQLSREFSYPPPETASVLLGFVLDDALRKQWEALDLTAVPRWPSRTSVVAAAESPHFERLKRHWAKTDQAASWHLVTSASVGANTTGALLGNEALDQIVQLVGGDRR